MSKPTDSQIISASLQKSPLLNHLHKTYPILNEIAQFTLSFSFINIITLFGLSSINQLKDINEVYFPFVNRFIEYIETVVVQWGFVKGIDYWVPFLQSLHLSDFTIKNIYASTINYITSTTLYKKAVEYATAILKYVNGKLNGWVQTAESVSNEATDSLANEVSKFTKVSYELFAQAKAFPFKVQDHVQKVYRDEFSKSNSNSIKAIASTSNELATEITNKLTTSFKKQVAENPVVADVTSAISTGVNGISKNNGAPSISSVEVTPSNVNGEISVGA